MMEIETYKGQRIYYWFVSGEKGFADASFYTTGYAQTQYGSIDEVKTAIDLKLAKQGDFSWI